MESEKQSTPLFVQAYQKMGSGCRKGFFNDPEKKESPFTELSHKSD